MKGMPAWWPKVWPMGSHCRHCGRTIYDFRDHLPRCPALGQEARR